MARQAHLADGVSRVPVIKHKVKVLLTLLQHPRTRRSGSCDSNLKKNRLSNRNQSGPIIRPTATQPDKSKEESDCQIENQSGPIVLPTATQPDKSKYPNLNREQQRRRGNHRNTPIQVEDGAAVEVEAEAEGEEAKGMV